MQLNISLFLIYLVLLVYVNCSCIPTYSKSKAISSKVISSKTLPSNNLQKRYCTTTKVGCVMSTICGMVKSVPASFTKIDTNTLPSITKNTATLENINITTETVPTTSCPPKGNHLLKSSKCEYNGGVFHLSTITASYNGEPCTTVDGTCEYSSTKSIAKTISKTVPTIIPSTTSSVSRIPTNCPIKGNHLLKSSKCEYNGGVFHLSTITASYNGEPCTIVDGTCEYPSTKSIAKTTSKTVPTIIPTTTDIPNTITVIDNEPLPTIPYSTKTKVPTTSGISRTITNCPPKNIHLLKSSECVYHGGAFYQSTIISTYNGEPCYTIDGTCDYLKTKFISKTTSKTIPTIIPTTTDTETLTTIPYTTKTTKVPTTSGISRTITNCPPKNIHLLKSSECVYHGGAFYQSTIISTYNGEPCYTVDGTCDYLKTKFISKTTSKTIPTTTTTTTAKTIPTTTKCISGTITITEKEEETVTLRETITVTINGEKTSTAEKEDDKNCASQWAQCGGTDYNGPKCCKSGLICQKISNYYSQCIKK
ncbi:hypothetical protein BCR32DRAFT_327305 [Anaeromyces robustus]|uniref:CBM1 domain-containing protein n=1 Tax=Anaeromyces robustus TaxID=1754192 RepID=A0A1Y1X6K6_9FUNG|nr:hypothetical protein BCR32DRAFT_327305 [Anaeromyces robustus]|eukprot:ORX81420.1 hypothetical protein BCR32DRAFT_327305 [Anaeromyces robustus]